MKKIILTLVLALIGILGINIAASAYGPGPYPHHYGPHPGDRMEASRVLDETRDYIFRAQRVALGYQQGDLRSAFDIQAEARDLYRRWFYQRAIQRSLQAREIAQNIIYEAGRRQPPPPPPHHHRRSSLHINLNL